MGTPQRRHDEASGSVGPDGKGRIRSDIWRRLRWWALLAGLIALAIAWVPSRRVTLDRSIDSLFAEGDPALRDYRLLQNSFGGNAVVMLVYHDAGLWSPQGLARNASISDRVSKIEGVRGVLSTSRLNGLLETFLADSGVPAFLRDDPIATRFEELFAGYTHSSDRQNGAVVAMLREDHGPETIEGLRKLAGDLPPPLADGDLVGEPVLLHDGFDLIERDGRTLATWTLAALGVVLVWTLRGLRFALLAILVVIWADTLTRAVMDWSGIRLSLVSTILLTVVTVIAVASVLHLGVRWQRQRRRGRDARMATVRATALMALPIALTCATDAAGFAALGWSRIAPVRHFGVMIATAALLVLPALVCFGPALLTFRDPPRRRFPRSPDRATIGDRSGGSWDRWQAAERAVRRVSLLWARASVRHARPVLAFSGVVTLAAIWVAAGAETETSFLSNFSPGSPIVAAYERVEREFGGAGVWDVVLEAPPEITADFLALVREIESDLREINVEGARLTKVLSLADADAIAADVPLVGLAPPAVRLAGMRAALPVFVDALLVPSGQGIPRRMRIMLRSPEQLSADQKIRLIGAVREVVRRHSGDPRFGPASADVSAKPSTNVSANASTNASANGPTGASAGDSSIAPGEGSVDVPAGGPRGRVTGYYVLMSGLVGQLLADQWRCFGLAATAVGLILLLATRSWRLALSALVPNLTPVLVVLAGTVWLGGKWDMGAAMIAAVSIGLTIDGSVHFLVAYRRHRDRGHDVETSAVHAAGGIALPITLATLALVVGFGVVSTSGFVPTATFGRLVTWSLLLGAIVNLTVLPATVSRFDRRSRR